VLQRVPFVVLRIEFQGDIVPERQQGRCFSAHCSTAGLSNTLLVCLPCAKCEPLVARLSGSTWLTMGAIDAPTRLAPARALIDYGSRAAQPARVRAFIDLAVQRPANNPALVSSAQELAAAQACAHEAPRQTSADSSPLLSAARWPVAASARSIDPLGDPGASSAAFALHPVCRAGNLVAAV
jgi:hypothetical protein